jgi:hypothetical protein
MAPAEAASSHKLNARAPVAHASGNANVMDRSKGDLRDVTKASIP